MGTAAGMTDELPFLSLIRPSVKFGVNYAHQSCARRTVKKWGGEMLQRSGLARGHGEVPWC